MKKRLLIITTGGTLASSQGEEGLAPELNSTEIFSSMEGIMNYYDVEFMDLMSIDSSNMQPEEWKLIAQTVYEKKDDYQGMVIIHGTDTMAYTAAALSFMLQNIPIPVVLTGSQLSILNPIADAVENCRCAVNMAGSEVPGVFVAFNRKIILGTRASKVRTISFDAFESINYPYVGVVNSNGLDINRYAVKKSHRHFELKDKLSTKVFLLKLMPGTNPDIFEQLYQMGYKGVVVEAFGIGGMHFKKRNLPEAIKSVVAKGMTVVVGSQCLYEGSNLSVYQAGQKILKQGVLPCNDMTTEAAVTKLMWVLGQTEEKKEIESLFLKNLAGEVTVPKEKRMNIARNEELEMNQEKRNIKLICSDIDGTLVPDGTSKINREVFDAILSLKEKGIMFAAASGRQYESIRNLFEPVANDIIFISENGNLVMCRGEVMARKEICKEDVEDIKKKVDAIPDCELMLSGVKTTYIRKADTDLYRLMNEGYHYDITLVDDFDDSIDDTIIKISMFQKDGRVEEVAGEEFMKLWDKHPRITAVCAGKEWIDLFDKKGNKGNAIEQIQTIMGIKISETMVFGDNLNDIEMLHRAEYSYAVKNAREEVKKEANYIADTNVNDGVLKELKKLLKELS